MTARRWTGCTLNATNPPQISFIRGTGLRGRSASWLRSSTACPEAAAAPMELSKDAGHVRVALRGNLSRAQAMQIMGHKYVPVVRRNGARRAGDGFLHLDRMVGIWR